MFFLFIHFPDLWKLLFYMESMFPSYSLLNMKVTWVYQLKLSNFMSGFLYFATKVEDIKYNLQFCNFFPIKGSIF